MKHKILFIMHMPPPVHGAAMMGKYIHESKLINDTFECRYINPTNAKDLTDIAKIRIKKIFEFVILLRRIKKEIKQFQPDICYVTPASGRLGFYKSFIIVQWIKIFHHNIIAHFHNKGISERQNELIDNQLFKLFFKNLKVILISPHLFYDIKKYISAENVSYCPNGIKHFSNTTHHFNTETFKILFLSNMMIEKGVLDLLDICEQLALMKKNFECHFIGKWSDIKEDFFNEYVKKHDLENYVHAHGPKYDEEKIAFYESADCFVFPTFYKNETFGLVLVEAMQFGIPCISTFEGGIPDVIDNRETGYLIEKHDIKDFTNKIVYLMDHIEERIRLGENAKEKYKKEFTLETFEKRLTSILSSSITHNHA